jgi:UDP-N-acetylmuramoylalanine--D-glutamate ligase
VRISELEGRRVAIWGYGREGRAAYAAIRQRLGSLPLTVFCNAEEAAALRALDDSALRIETEAVLESLAGYQVVIKSPGISPYASPAADLALQDVRLTSGTALWFAENPGARSICITGTKGKSTTTALVAHLLRAAGRRTALAGNIGLPLLDLLDVEPTPQHWAIELSSFQTREATAPDIALALNLYPEHLDWHGSEQRYYEDKLSLLCQSMPRVALANAGDPRLAAWRWPEGLDLRWFNHGEGWHERDGWIFRGEEVVLDARALPLPGQHNRLNLCAAFAAVEAAGLDAVAYADAVANFVPLPHRLQSLGVRGGIEYVNDSISTTPHASLAALDCNPGRRVAILVGGYDRGVDWGVFAERMKTAPPQAVVTMGQNGPRIHDLLRPLTYSDRFTLAEAGDVDEAVRKAAALLDHRGVVLLSPGAPSFPRYRDYVDRGRHFARAAGFDPDLISTIPGLGVA